MPRVKDEPGTERSHRRGHGSPPRASGSKSKPPSSAKKQRRHRRRSGTRSVSSDSDERADRALQAKLDAERERKRADVQRRKLEMKATETPEEKRARRLAKKLAKEQKKKMEMGWSKEDMGYTNVDNPFGDAQLTEPFVWANKLKKQGIKNVTKEELAQSMRRRIEANREETETYRQRREEREQEREEREAEARDREGAQFQQWSKQEEQFHLNQALMRSKIRIQEGRPKPIDLLFWYTQTGTREQEELGVEMNEPQTYLADLTQRDMEDLLADVQIIRQCEAAAAGGDEALGDGNKDFWDDITTIVQHRLDTLRKADPTCDVYEAAGRRQGIHTAVDAELQGIFTGKSYAELSLLEVNILSKVKGQQEGVDVAYWESLLGRLKLSMAEARLRDRHTRTLELKLDTMRQEQLQLVPAKAEPEAERPPTPADAPLPADGDSGETAAPASAADADAAGPSTSRVCDDDDDEPKVELPEEREGDGGDNEEGAEGEDEEGGDSLLPAACDVYALAGYSPIYQPDDSLMPGTEVIDEHEDAQRTLFARQEFKSRGATREPGDQLLQKQAEATLGDEATFAVEAPLEHVKYLWSDKYRPRKPRYFNRVHTGFEWNKYNQTHYDQENPPPKIVQGYRFNMFYPDLLDPSKTPTFELIPCDDVDFAVLRFRAGPPYEDIAFKIVCREWECAHRKGYRCQFQNGIFQLWFHFKKYRYRR